MICNVITLAVTAGLTLGLAPVIGARGAAVATVAGEWTLAISLLVALVRASRRLVPNALSVAPRVMLAGGAALTMVLLPLPAIAQLALAVAVYVAMIVVLRVLPNELLELIPGRLADTRR